MKATISLPPLTHRSLRVLTAAVLLCTGADLAQSGANHHTPGSVTSDGRFTPNVAGGTFPPQPRGITNERRYIPVPPAADAQASPAAAAGVTTKATPAGGPTQVSLTVTATAHPGVRALLGNRYAHVRTTEQRDKWQPAHAMHSGKPTRHVLVFFSHSNNSTVSVLMANGQVEQVAQQPARSHQPPLAQSEKDDAIALARQWWQARGNTRVDALTGFAIQTYQPDGSLHESRMAYVSFHPGADALPELLTWVDLSSATVIRGQID